MGRCYCTDNVACFDLWRWIHINTYFLQSLIPLVHCVLWSWKQDEHKKGETQGSGKLVEKLDGGCLDGGWMMVEWGGKGGSVRNVETKVC